MNLINRSSSIITGKGYLEPLYTYKNFPVFFGCVDTEPYEDVRADMSWAICQESGVIQIDKLIPLELLYQSQHMDGTGPTWQSFYEDFASYIAVVSPVKVLEIGGGQGALAEVFIKKTKGTTWTIVEPNPLHPGNNRIKVIKAFFDERFNHKDEYDAVVMSHTLEHAYDPNQFLKDIASYLCPGQRLIFAYPNLRLWLEKKYTTALNFEHSVFLTDYFVDYLLVRHGLRIDEKHLYGEHSIYYTVEKLEKPDPLPRFENKYNEYKMLFLDFIAYHTSLIAKLNRVMRLHTDSVFLFGAHIFSQYLLEFGLDTRRISAILDNSRLKIGKRLYGSTLKVASPEILKGERNPAVILKVGPYRNEIEEQIKKINPSTVFFE
jgi:SAM-dependent methyltransferase